MNAPATLELFDVAEAPRMPPCSLCGSPGIRAGCFRCETRRSVFAPPTREEREAFKLQREQLAAELAERQRRAEARIAALGALGRPVRIYVVGCGKKKLDRPAPARELYTGGLFRASLRCAEAAADELHILSALYGLVSPSTELQPYNFKLNALRLDERRAWGIRAAHALVARYADLPVELTILAGRAYAAALRAGIPSTWTVAEPLRGLGVGARLRALTTHANTERETNACAC